MTILFAPFAIFFPGYFFLKSIWGKNEKLNFWEAIILSIGISFLLGYPVGLSNNIIEYFYSPNPYQVHIDTLFPIYILLCSCLYYISRKKESFHGKFEAPEKKWLYLILSIFALGIFLRIYGNANQNINGDEQELSLYSYHLFSGILVGRDAFFLSGTDHSPLGYFVSFIIYSLVTPFQYAYLPEYILRSPMIVFGLLELALFLLFAKSLKLSKTITAFGLLLLSINTYAIFGSRLMIPQDGSVFTFFVLLFSYFFIRFLQKKNSPSKLDIFLIGLLAASTILVKLSAIFLIPPFIFFWLFNKKGYKNLFQTSLVTLFFFLPVIVFNICAYQLTGYTDVPTAKLLNLLGFNANSIMGNVGLYSEITPSFFKTLAGFLQLLADQWSLLIAINLFASIPLVFIFRKNLKDRIIPIYFFISIILISILFFSFNGYRAYYAEYLTIPFLLLSLFVLGQINWKNIMLKVSVILWSCIYTVWAFIYALNTHIFVIPMDDTILEGEYGRSNIYSYQAFKQHISLASWGFLQDDGFTVLQKFLQDKDQLLVIEDSFLLSYKHQFRWYLGIFREVDAHYLGSAYKDDFEYISSSKFDYSKDAIEILKYSDDKLKEDDFLIKDHNGEPKMIIRYLKRQEFLLPAQSMSTF